MGFEGCELKIGGKTDSEPYLETVELSESLDMLDSIRVRMRIPRGEDRAKILATCQPGTTWEVKFGKRTAKGDVTRVSITMGERGVPTVVLFGLEALNRLRHIHVSKLIEDPKHKIVSARQ